MHMNTNDREDSATFLPGSDALPSPARRAGQTVIFFPYPQPRTAALWDEDEASVSDELPPSIGTLAVKLVAEWSLPRLQVFVQAPTEEDQSGPA